MLILLAILMAVLMGAWMSVVNIDKMPSDHLQKIADSLTSIMFDYASGFLLMLLVTFGIGIILQKTRRFVLSQTITFSVWFVPLVYILYKVSVFYDESLLAPAYYFPLVLVVIGLAWVSWQTAKFMSSCESAIASKLRK